MLHPTEATRTLVTVCFAEHSGKGLKEKEALPLEDTTEGRMLGSTVHKSRLWQGAEHRRGKNRGARGKKWRRRESQLSTLLRITEG